MIINKLKMDLNRCGVAPVVDAVQGDVCSRLLEIFLHSAGEPFMLPENLAVLIRYKKADGKGGEYDTLPDGASAWSVQGNILTLTLAPQVLTFPGEVFMTVALIAEGKQLSTFPLRILVQPSAQPLAADSEDYFRITGFLAAPGNAKEGQYLQISSVDASGRVTGISAADVVTFSGDGGTSDWNAAPGQPGHILNRPFYTKPEIQVLLEQVSLEASGSFAGIENVGFLPGPLELSDGQRCTVIYNGTEYECTASADVFQQLPVFLLGNAVNFGNQDTGEPFLMCIIHPDAVASAGIYGGVISLDGSAAFTIAVTCIVETVHPLDAKFLTNARCQRKILLDLDNNTTSIPIEDTLEIDLAELQSATTVIYQGIAHAASIQSRTSELSGNTEIHSILFLIYHPDPAGSSTPRAIHCCWSTLELRVTSETTFEQLIQISSQETLLYGKLPEDTNPNWRRITELPLDGIWLKSTTASSAKKFLITVDDSGTLTVTQKQY